MITDWKHLINTHLHGKINSEKLIKGFKLNIIKHVIKLEYNGNYISDIEFEIKVLYLYM